MLSILNPEELEGGFYIPVPGRKTHPRLPTKSSPLLQSIFISTTNHCILSRLGSNKLSGLGNRGSGSGCGNSPFALSDTWSSLSRNFHHNFITTHKNSTPTTNRILPFVLYAMEIEIRTASGTKRPAEPEPDPEVQPRQTSTSAKRITLRISSIPIRVTKEYLSRMLEGLTPPRNQTDEAIDQPQNPQKRHRGTNICSLSLAPSSSGYDSDTYQVATVTFREIPTALAGCVSNTNTIIVSLGVDGGGEEIEVDVDSHFRGLTPLNHPSNPLVEYVRSLPRIGIANLIWCLALLLSPDSQDMPLVHGGRAILGRCGCEI